MLMREALANLVSRIYIISVADLMLVIVLLAALNGCAEDGGGQAISSLSTPVNTTVGQSSEPSPSFTDAHQARPAYSASFAPTEETTDLTADLVYTDGPPPRSESADDLATTVTSTPTGVTVRLYWPRSADSNILGYYVYYGREPAQEEGLCSSYEAHQVVEAPPATITGLDHDTLYFFAVKKFNESDHSCSEEMMVDTPPAPAEQTEVSMESPVHYSGLALKS